MYVFAQPSPAPGRESGNAITTQPSTPGPAAPESQQSQGPFGGMGMLLVMALPLLLLVLMTRSQSKKQKELEASLKVGDRVVTQSGLFGKITDMGERTAKLEIAPGVNVQVLKTSIQGPDVVPDAKKDDKAKDDKKDSAKDAKDKEAVKEKK